MTSTARARHVRAFIVATVGAVVLVAGAPRTLAGEILFVSDRTADSVNIPAVLQGDGHEVTVVTDDFLYGNLTLLGPLDMYDAVFWNASGDFTGSTHDSEVIWNLHWYVLRGGYVFVTGYDAVASPDDATLQHFLGAWEALDRRSIPDTPGPVVNAANSLTVGVVDIRGVTPTGGYADWDSLLALKPTTVGVVPDAAGEGYRWTLRTRGAGRIAWVSNGVNAASGNGDHPSWLDTTPPPSGKGAYNAALRNFAKNSARPPQYQRYPWEASREPLYAIGHPPGDETTNDFPLTEMSLYRIDQFTGASELVGPTGMEHLSALAIHPVTGTIYSGFGYDHDRPADQRWSVVTLDPDTGAATVVLWVDYGLPGSWDFSPDGTLWAGGASYRDLVHEAYTVDFSAASLSLYGRFIEGTEAIAWDPQAGLLRGSTPNAIYTLYPSEPVNFDDEEPWVEVPSDMLLKPLSGFEIRSDGKIFGSPSWWNQHPSGIPTLLASYRKIPPTGELYEYTTLDAVLIGDPGIMIHDLAFGPLQDPRFSPPHLPTLGSFRPGRVRAPEGGKLTASAHIDLGGGTLDLTNKCLLRIGSREYAIPGMRVRRRGQDARWRSEDGSVRLRINAPTRSADSLYRFKLQIREFSDTLNPVPNGELLPIDFECGDFAAGCVAVLEDRSFRAGVQPMAANSLAVRRIQVSTRGRWADTVAISAQIPGEGIIPPDAEQLIVRFGQPGNLLEFLVASADYDVTATDDGYRYDLPDPDGPRGALRATGLYRVDLEHSRNEVRLFARGLDLGDLPPGTAPFYVSFGTESEGEAAVQVTVETGNGRRLRYR